MNTTRQRTRRPDIRKFACDSGKIALNQPRLYLLVFSLLVLTSCHQQRHDAQSSAYSTQRSSQLDADQQLKQLLNEYSRQELNFSPLQATYLGISGFDDKFQPASTPQFRKKWLQFQQRWAEKLKHIDSTQLSKQGRLSWQVFLYDRRIEIEGTKYPDYLFPANQMFGLHNVFADLGSGESSQPFKTEKDYRNFISRAKGFSQWVDNTIDNMREGITKNIVFPTVIVKKIIPQLDAHLVKHIDESIFYAPLKKLPTSLSKMESQKLKSDYVKTIQQVIIPAYRRLSDFLKKEYLAKTRKSIGLSKIENGKSWYRYLIKRNTTLSLSAEEIHQFGLQEVSRILGEMKKVKTQVKFKGDLVHFFHFLRNDPQFYFETDRELLQGYRQVKAKIAAKLPLLFSVFPQTDYEVKLVPAFRAASSPGAYYNGPSADGKRPGVFYINAYNLKSQPWFLMETLSIHEAAPGHHFQVTLQQEAKGLPPYRKYNDYTAFSEGWALYAESLGKELGLFTDPYMWYGRLSDEQLRAMRLVVDTGIHAMGWSRQQAIDYMMKNSSMAKSDITAEVERYIVIPGQALSYKIGERTIRQLRQHAEKILGQEFDIRAFHREILLNGSLPMPILRKQIENWISAEKLRSNH